MILNMIDIAEAKGINIDFNKLSKELGVKLIPVSASKGKGLDKVKDLLLNIDVSELSIDNDFKYQNFKNEKKFIHILKNY